VNVACLEGISPFDLAEVTVLDGVNHVKDRGGGQAPNRLGVLKFIKS
jgi:hypothetical protein